MKVFISHTAADADLARELAEQLAEQGYDVWRPEVDVLPGDNIWLKTGEALEQSNAMVVLMSAKAARSEKSKSSPIPAFAATSKASMMNAGATGKPIGTSSVWTISWDAK